MNPETQILPEAEKEICCKGKICREKNCNCSDNCECGCKAKCLCLKYSQRLWRTPIKAIGLSVILNVLYIILANSNQNILSLIWYGFMLYIFIRMYIYKDKKLNKEENELNAQENLKKINEKMDKVKKYIDSLCNISDLNSQIKLFVTLYLIGCMINFLGCKIVGWLLLNIILFSAFIKRYWNFILDYIIFPPFLTVQGIIAIADAAIPRYEDPSLMKEDKDKKEDKKKINFRKKK